MRRRPHLRYRAGIEQSPARHHAHPVADLLHLVEQVAGEDDGAPAARRQAAHQFPDFNNAGRVQTVGRLVKNQQRRIAQQRGGNAQALFHARGTGAKLAVGRAARQPHGRQQAVNFGRAAAGGVQTLEAAQIVAAGQVGPEKGAFNQRAGMTQGGAVAGGAGLPQQGYGPGGGAQKAGQH